ncbi:hypothetical protein [Gimesia aquarii]|uniref:hypothetical protein n=1 Tax=Gimesia aquarii TaxID=2527964 RepID=UPI0011A6C4CC|nr:hypothetical protein [Gimesia aquarii]
MRMQEIDVDIVMKSMDINNTDGPAIIRMYASGFPEAGALPLLITVMTKSAKIAVDTAPTTASVASGR